MPDHKAVQRGIIAPLRSGRPSGKSPFAMLSATLGVLVITGLLQFAPAAASAAGSPPPATSTPSPVPQDVPPIVSPPTVVPGPVEGSFVTPPVNEPAIEAPAPQQPAAPPALPPTPRQVPVPSGFTLPGLPAGTPTPTATGPAPGTIPPANTEITSARTANANTYQNKDGTRTALLRQNLNYQSSPGHFDPVDLNFRTVNGTMVADHSAVPVRVSPQGVGATEASGQGLRWITPSMPQVSGTSATVSMNGLTWNFSPTGAGMAFSAVVTTRRGPTTYRFPYQLLGGAKPLSVDPQGGLVSDQISISRASVVGSDGIPHQASAWSLLPGSVASFSFDDSSVGTPYVIDPSTNVGLHTNAGESFAKSGLTYPPTSGTTTYAGNNWLLAADQYDTSTGQYSVADAALSWDTSSIPSTAVGLSGSAAVGLCESLASNAGMQIYADWVTGTLSPSMYPPLPAVPNPMPPVRR